MNDFDYDVYQKKRIATGDRHRKRGSKSKYCGLPSDHMTQAQWKKKNGEVKVMNLSAPMSWTQFKAMPNDLQKEYIQKLVLQFHCRQADLCELFGVNSNTVCRKFKEIGIDSALFPKGKRPKSEDLCRFRKWVNGDAGEVRETLPKDESPTTNPTPAPSSVLACADRFEAEWSGDMNLVEILQTVHRFANGDHMRLRIIAERIS